MTLVELQRVLSGRALEDVLITGFIDEEEQPARFRALYRAIYVEFDGVLLKFSTIEDSGRMHISIAEAVSCDAGLDESLRPACSSIRQAVLRDPDGTNQLATMHLWDSQEAPSGIECAAARFDLKNGQQMFFDPSYHFGIRIGGSEQQSCWTENWPQAAEKQIYV